jgi:hypothetical protein
VQFGQVFFEDNRNECSFFPHFPLSWLQYGNTGGLNNTTTSDDVDPIDHSGPSSDHSGGLSIDYPEGNRNKFSESGSHTLEWSGSRHDCG